MYISKATANRASFCGEDTRRPNTRPLPNHMAVAVVKKEYWLGNDDDFVDIDKVISNIQKYESFQDSVISDKTKLFQTKSVEG